MNFHITILGSNSALAAHGRHPSSQYIKLDHHHILMDCGEGSQFRMNELKLSKVKLEYIFISHLHGDHVFGLPGLITSMILLGRKESLTIVGPIGIKDFIENITKSTFTHFSFPIHCIETNPEEHQLVLEEATFQVENIPLSHGVPCNGYLFRQKERPLNLKEEVIGKYNLNTKQIIELKARKSIAVDGGYLHPDEALYVKNKARSYAYCSDTAYHSAIVPIIRNIDLLYHEATYLEEYQEKARQRGHSTAIEASTIAKDAGVGRLLIGHPSSKYADIRPLVEEARSVFEATEFAYEGRVFDV